LPDTAFTGINANNDRVTAESFGFYAQFNWSLNEQWDLDIGARYSEETRGLNNVEVNVVAGSCTHEGPGAPPPTEICAPQIVLNRESVLNQGIYNDATADYDSVTPMVSLTRHLAGGGRLEDGMVYFLYSTGWLTGAFNDELNTNLVPELEPLKSFGDEHVSNYEVGFKGTLAGGNVRIAGDVFFMQYKDKQESITLPNPDGVFGPDQSIELTQNASDVLISGIELEVRAALWEGGFVTLDFGFLDQEYDSFTAFDPDTFEVVDFSDTATITSRTPDWTINASVEHAFALANGATITPQLGVYMADDYQWQEGLVQGEASPNCLQESYSKWRTRITYAPSAGNWSASLYGNNITDEEIKNLCGPGRTGVYRWLLEPPAWWGAEFTMRFGANN
jgi:iron complex outermembrane receptor protein